MKKQCLVLTFNLFLISCFHSVEEYRFDKVYRISIPTPILSGGSAGSTVLNNGEWFLVFKGETADSQSGGKLLAMKSSNSGRTWTRPDTIVKTVLDCGKPYVYQLRDGLIIVSFALYRPKTDKQNLKSTGYFIVSSYDHGKNFTAPKYVSVQGYTDIEPSDNILELQDGSFLLPASVKNQDGFNESIVIISHDRGDSFTEVIKIKSELSLLTQKSGPSIVQLSDGTLLCMVEENGRLYQATSSDQGYTWNFLRYSGVLGRNPDLLYSPEGILVCTYQDFWPCGVSVSKSYDHGETWETKKTLMWIDQKEFISPDLVLLDHQKLAVSTFTGNKLEALFFKETRLLPPKGFSLSAHRSNHVFLRWNRVEGASYYLIYRDQNPNFENQSGYPFKGNALIGLTETQYVDTSVDSGKTYYYRISSVAGSGKLIEGLGSESELSAPRGITVK